MAKLRELGSGLLGWKLACLVVPENAIRVETDVPSGELACVRAANNGKRLKNVERPGVQVARFEMVGRTSASDRRDKRSSSSVQAARR